MNLQNTVRKLVEWGLLAAGSNAVTQTKGITANVTGDLKGNVEGDVTGNLTGNVTGNVTGNLTGNVTGNVTAAGLTGGALHASAPTQAELVALLGSAATAGAFAVRVAKRTSGDMFFCVSDGTSWYRALAAVGA